MCDGYSKLVKAVVTRNQTAETVVKMLLKEWIFVYGTPDTKDLKDNTENTSDTITLSVLDYIRVYIYTLISYF